MSSKPTQFTVLWVKKRQKIQSSFQKRITAHFTFSEITTTSDWNHFIRLCTCVLYKYGKSKKGQLTSEKNFNGVHNTSKVKVVANARFMQLRPDLQAGHLPEVSRDLKAWWSKRHSWSWKALGKKIMLTRLGDKWKDPWWFLWEGCEKEVKCKPFRKQKREFKRRTVFSDVILQLQLNPSSTTLGIEESGCCKEVAVVERWKQVSIMDCPPKMWSL